MGAWALRVTAAALVAAALCAAAATTATTATMSSTGFSSTRETPSSSPVPLAPTPSSPTEASTTAATGSGTAAAAAADATPMRRHVRLATRDIQRFRSYKDVSVLPFDVPHRTHFASFNFTVKEVATSTIAKKCPPRNVTVVIKYGSYPVVAPDSARFPDNYETRRLPYYEDEFSSDGKPRAVNVTNPLPGDWYAVAFLSYTDPNNDKIVQQGLSASCVALLEAALDVSVPEEVKVQELEAGHAAAVRAEGHDAAALSRLFRSFAPAGARVARIQLHPAACSRARPACPALALAARSQAFPGSTPEDGGGDTRRVSCTIDDACTLTLVPLDAAWLYVAVEATPDPKLMDKDVLIGYYLNVTFETEACYEGEECWVAEELMRQSFVQLFMYNFVRVPDLSKPSPDPSQPPTVNVSTAVATLLTFDVSPVKDVGGTLTLELRLDQTPVLMNVTSVSSGSVNVSVLACLSFATKRLPSFPDTCIDTATGASFPASVRLNTTSPENFTGKLHVPFPEPGPWFLSLKPFCFAGNGSEADCGELNETQVAFVLDSEMCGSDRCGRWGHCNNYLSGGVIFATCICQHGYRGWGCTDDERIDKLSDLLLASLLLTLSNLPFLPAAVLAALRGYYTEAFVYCCTLFFSTFYHACEAGEDVYYYCMMPLHVLQFCDFFSAILALWVTLVAMADVPPTAKSLLHMAGAVGVALGTEYDRTSLSVFMVPTILGLVLMGGRWAFRCRAQRACYPHKSYWIFCFPPGAVLVLVGVVCFSFLQTRSNYKYVHSAWHSMMAVAIMFVLPSRRQRAFESVESDDSVDSATPFWKRTKWCGCRSCR